MADLDETLHKANQAEPKAAKEAGEAVGKAIDAENAKMERERKKKFDKEVKEISKYHGKKHVRGTKFFFFEGGDSE